jgi:hypothetical protein
MFLIFYILIEFSVIDNNKGSLVYRLSVVLALNQLACSMKFKEDFDFLLTMSSTRMEIFKSMLGAAVVVSIICSVLILIEQYIVDFLNNSFGFLNIIDPFHFFAAYSIENLLSQFVYFFMLCVFFSIFGLLMGSLFAVFVILLPLLALNFYRHDQLSNSFTAMKEFLMNFNVISGSVYLFIFSIIFALIAYLNIRKLPQK